MRWDRWIGNYEEGDDPAGDRPVMWIKHLINIRWPFRFVVDLHMFSRADDPKCYHTHPYWAIRIPLWGGYIEEMEDGTLHVIWPFRIGVVGVKHCHQVRSMLFAKRAYSLWIRGESTHSVETRGEGWKRLRLQCLETEDLEKAVVKEIVQEAEAIVASKADLESAKGNAEKVAILQTQVIGRAHNIQSSLGVLSCVV